MPFSLRLDPATEAKIRRLAARTRRSRSEVVREAVAQYGADTASPEESEASTFDRLKAFAGVVGTGGADFSQDTHAKYRDLVKRKGRARRSR
jgi:predicted transcriptional regulator